MKGTITMTDAEISTVLAALKAGAQIETIDEHHLAKWQRTRIGNLRARLFAILQELPDEMTVSELRDVVEPGGYLGQELSRDF
jgi:hypothetical protein